MSETLRASPRRKPASPIDASRPLNLREQALVDAYLATHDIEAAAAAGHYTVKGAESVLRRPRIALAIAQGRGRWNERLSASRERLQAELAAIAFADPMDALYESEEGYRARPLHEIPEHARRSIQSIRVGVKGDVTVRFWDKLEAARLLAQLSGWLDQTTVIDARTQVVIPALSQASLEDLRQLAAGEPEGPFDVPLQAPQPPDVEPRETDAPGEETAMVDG